MTPFDRFFLVGLIVFSVIVCAMRASAQETRSMAFEWDAVSLPVDGHRVYVRPAPTEAEPEPEWQAFAATESLEVEGDFPAAPFQIGVTSFRTLDNGDGPGSGGDVESEKSVLLVHEEPDPPVKLRLVTEVSDDLSTWKPLASQVIEVDPDTGRKFFRTVIVPEP